MWVRLPVPQEHQHLTRVLLHSKYLERPITKGRSFMTPEFKELELDSLYISPRNVRSDTGDLTELIDSIRDMGVLEPILVRQKGDEYEVIAGRRRLEAARIIGLPTIPASVLDVTDLQAIIISLIENIQRKDLTLAERVQTYQTLQQLDPDYRSQRSLAKAIRVSHRKISEDFQVYEIALKLQPYGIRVESDFPLSAPERQEGLVLPEYHAVLLHQAMAASPAVSTLSLTMSLSICLLRNNRNASPSPSPGRGYSNSCFAQGFGKGK
jgi:ParB/RepB/Spo0J family partition protein